MGACPVAGSVRPTGLSVPKRGASTPLRAISSMGWQAWNRSRVSKFAADHAIGARPAAR